MILAKFALTDRAAIVTGAGKGIGKGIALGFAEAGANVVCAARTETDIEATAALIREMGRKALVVPMDVRRSDLVDYMVQQTLEEFGRIDILVNNAGGSFWVKAMEMSENAWDSIVRENLKSVFLCSKAVARVMLDQKKGNIINISSTGAKVASPNMSAYAAAKAGVINLTQTLAVEWAPYVRVNCIAPGGIETPGLQENRLRPGQADVAISDVPLGRMGRPEDIAAAAVYLASDAAEWVTGITIDVAGGPVRH